MSNGDMKIVVLAARPISAGEEVSLDAGRWSHDPRHAQLTYDYQFDLEDESTKIACLCTAPNCRKWMN